MSGEWGGSNYGYFHNLALAMSYDIEEAGEEHHRALYPFYDELASLARHIAWVEAYDSAPSPQNVLAHLRKLRECIEAAEVEVQRLAAAATEKQDGDGRQA